MNNSSNSFHWVLIQQVYFVLPVYLSVVAVEQKVDRLVGPFVFVHDVVVVLVKEQWLFVFLLFLYVLFLHDLCAPVPPFLFVLVPLLHVLSFHVLCVPVPLSLYVLFLLIHAAYVLALHAAYVLPFLFEPFLLVLY